MNFGNAEANRNIAAMEEYARIGDAAVAAAATATYDKSNFSKWSDCTFETPFVPAAGRDTNTNALLLNAQEMRKNMLDSSYFSDFKSLQGSVPFSSNAGNKSHFDTIPKCVLLGQVDKIGKHLSRAQPFYFHSFVLFENHS